MKNLVTYLLKSLVSKCRPDLFTRLRDIAETQIPANLKPIVVHLHVNHSQRKIQHERAPKLPLTLTTRPAPLPGHAHSTHHVVSGRDWAVHLYLPTNHPYCDPPASHQNTDIHILTRSPPPTHLWPAMQQE